MTPDQIENGSPRQQPETVVRHPRQITPLVASEIYLHVGNGGVIFQVIDEGFGPTIIIDSMFFGNAHQTMKIYTNVEGLKAVRDAIDKSLQHQDWSPEYCHAAVCSGNVGDGAATSGGQGQFSGS